MIQGLADVNADLCARQIKFVVGHGMPTRIALRYARSAAMIVCDRGYTRHQTLWRDEVADGAKCPVVQVESDVVIPVETVSDHAEFAARTIRPKIYRAWDEYLAPVKASPIKHAALSMRIAGDIDITDPDRALKELKLDRSVKQSTHFDGGQRAARKLLNRFLHTRLQDYAKRRNEPAAGQTSTLSPYLHFGNISPIEIALRVRQSKCGSQADRDSFLEELIVRRELDINFVHYNNRFDSFDGLPNWAKKTLRDHESDERPIVYTARQLEAAQTHDPFWNAAQQQMTRTGFMHNYMRMYWGKKIIEWTRSPRRAYEIALQLNNKYFIDGRDPVSFANIAWLFGLHDRPWGPARKIFGTVRYMNEAGLRRKFDMDAYVSMVESLR
jgi:deoxyribodipyrimidine photo-lyase